MVGSADGEMVCRSTSMSCCWESSILGVVVGTSVGTTLGRSVGNIVGLSVGVAVGVSVGTDVPVFCSNW